MKAQDPTFSQFYLNNLFYNPAFVGLDQGMRVGINYRSLWSRVPGNFPTYTVSADLQDLHYSSGIGFIGMNDAEGTGILRTVSVGGVYSYRIVLVPKESILQVGFQTSFVNRSINWNRLLFSDQLDPLYGQIKDQTSAITPNQLSISYVDFNMGSLLRFNVRNRYHSLLGTFTLGAAIQHLVKPNQSFIGLDSRLPMKYTVHGTAVFAVSKRHTKNKLLLSPYFVYEKQDVFTTINGGAMVLQSPVYAGLAYRNIAPQYYDIKSADALIVLFGYKGKLKDRDIDYKIGYSYDITVSNLRSKTAGSQEVGIVLEFNKVNKRDNAHSKKQVNCYGF